jgi:glutamate/tyrosine decarboxylase-like PLP-dependent enzyme
VTGGATPAALAGDWLTSAFDQNATGYGDSVAPLIELETIAMLRDLFTLPESFFGVFVSGATLSNFTGLALARQWVGKQLGYDVAQEGLREPLKILAGTAHSSAYKALAMLGLGRGNLEKITCLDAREAINVRALEARLKQLEAPSIVIASAGTVNTVDYDDIVAIADLKTTYPFWLHVDAAFGGFAALSPKTSHLLKGWEAADSITIDAHKWLNVPYDSAMIFTRHEALQVEVFQNAATYLGQPGSEPNFVHRTPENSRRFRALAAWMTLQAYGKAGYQEIVERACTLAKSLAENIAASKHFRLLAPVSMNGICFTLEPQPTEADIKAYLERLKEDGRIFLTPTHVFGVPAIRISITNWQTLEPDIELAWEAMQAALLN